MNAYSQPGDDSKARGIENGIPVMAATNVFIVSHR